jgi:hypothetical protein
MRYDWENNTVNGQRYYGVLPLAKVFVDGREIECELVDTETCECLEILKDEKGKAFIRDGEIAKGVVCGIIKLFWEDDARIGMALMAGCFSPEEKAELRREWEELHKGLRSPESEAADFGTASDAMERAIIAGCSCPAALLQDDIADLQRRTLDNGIWPGMSLIVGRTSSLVPTAQPNDPETDADAPTIVSE